MLKPFMLTIAILKIRFSSLMTGYWEKSGDTLTPKTGVNNVNAKHFFKININHYGTFNIYRHLSHIRW